MPKPVKQVKIDEDLHAFWKKRAENKRRDLQGQLNTDLEMLKIHLESGKGLSEIGE